MADVSFKQSIAQLVERADNAQPVRFRNNSGLPDDLAHLAPDELVQHVRQPAAASVVLPLQQVDLAGLFDDRGRLSHTPAAADAGSTVRLSTAVAGLSACSQAGAGVIQWDQAEKAVRLGAGTGEVALMRRPKALRIVKPAVFSELDHDADDDAEISDQAHPALVAPFDFKAAKTLAAAWTVSRADRRSVDPGVLAGEIAQAIVRGIAATADRLILDAIAATEPAPFTLAGLASRGFQLGNVAAIAGTAGAGAAIGEDGVLRAAGVPARLTDQAAVSVIGDFTRAALVLGETLDVHARKLNRDGSLEISVIATALPVIADPAAFWGVA